jgi:cytoskeletal protein CcmA (bactofilin family)
VVQQKSNWSMNFSGLTGSRAAGAGRADGHEQSVDPKASGEEASKLASALEISREGARGISSRRATAGSVDARIGSRSRMLGSFEFLGGAELSGEVEGEIVAGGDLILGETASVRASIRGERLKIFGHLEGDIVCSERVEAFAGAKIAGDIYCPRVVMHDGVVFDGTCQMDSPAVGQVELQSATGRAKPDGAPSAHTLTSPASNK